LRLKYEEKRVRDLGIGSDGLSLINKENQIVRKFLSRQDVGGFKSVVLAIDLRLKHGIHRDSADLPTSVRYRYLGSSRDRGKFSAYHYKSIKPIKKGQPRWSTSWSKESHLYFRTFFEIVRK